MADAGRLSIARERLVKAFAVVMATGTGACGDASENGGEARGGASSGGAASVSAGGLHEGGQGGRSSGGVASTQLGGGGSGGTRDAAGVGGFGGNMSHLGGGSGSNSMSGSGGVTNARAGGSNGGGAGGAQAGAAGNMGSAGAAGTAGSGCSLVNISDCDDHDSCTEDSLDEACMCSHRAMPNGASCDDGDACTEADQCHGGVCAGTARSQAAQTIAQLRSFGQGPGLQTLVAFTNDKRAVFAREKRLTLVGLDNDVATVLDDVAMSASVRSDSVGSMVWVSRPRTFVIPVLEHHVAVASIDRGIDLFDVSGDKLTPSETYGFGGANSWPVAAVVGQGSAFYACTPYQVQAWSINPTTYFMTPGPTLALASGHRCQGLGLSPDGLTLYAATSGGLEQIAIASDGKLSLQSEARQGNLTVDVQSSADHVAVFEIKDPTSGFGDVVVLRRDTLQELVTFAGELGASGSVPVGFSLLDSGRMLLQKLHNDGAGCPVHEALTLALSASPTELDRRTTFAACQSPFSSPSYHTVARGAVASLEPMHQLLRIEPSNAKMHLFTGPRQGSFERVRPGGAHSVLAYSADSVQRIDISDPSAPVASAGGLVSPLDFERLRLDVSNPAAASVLTLNDAAQGGPQGPVTSVLLSEGDGLPRLFGSIANDDASGPWVASGASLYQLSAVGSANFRLRRFPIAAIAPVSGQTLTPKLDQQLATSAPSALDVRRTPQFVVDSENGDIVVLEPRAKSNTSASDVGVLSAYAGADLKPLYSQALDPGIVAGLAAAGGRSVVLVNGNLFSVDRAGTRTPISLSGLVVESVLLLDTKKLVLAASWSSPSPSEGVVVLRPSDFSELARYPTVESATSFAEVSDHWVIGTRSSMAVATPACQSAP